MSEHLKTAAKDVKKVMILSLLGMIAGYLLRLYFARSLSVQDFGLLYAILSFTSIFVIFRDFGLSTTISKLISERLAEKKFSEIKSIVVSSVIIQVILGGIIATAVIFSSDYIALHYFNTTKAALPLQLMMLSFFVSIALTIFQSVAQGHARMELYASVEFLRIILTFSLAIFFISLGVTGITLSYLLASVILATIYIVLMKRKFKFFSYAYRHNRHVFKKIFVFSIPLFVGGVGNIALSYIDTIILTAFRSLDEVGFYNAAVPTAQILMIFSSISSAVLLPYVSKYWAQNTKEKISHGLTILVRFILIIVLPIAAGFIVFSDIAIGTLFGQSYLGATQALRLLEIAYVFSILYSLLGVTIIGIGKPVVYTKIHLAISLLSLCLNLILVPKIGIIGAATTSLVVYIIGFIIALCYVRKNVPLYIDKKNTSKVVISTAAVALFIYSLRMIFTIVTLEAAAMAFAAGVILYIAFISFFKIFNTEDEKTIESLGLRLPKAAKRILFRD